MRTCVARIDTVIFKHQGLVTMLLCPQCPGHILCAFHDAAALIVEAKNRGNHVGSAFCSFQGRRNFLLIANTASRWCGASAETRYESLLLHSRLGLDRACHTLEIPHLIPLVCSKGDRLPSDESLHLHITGRHQSARHAMQIDTLISLVNMVRLHLPDPLVRREKSRLYHEGRLELRRQFLASFARSPQDTQAGCPA